MQPYQTTKQGIFYAGFDSQVNDSWIVVLDSQGKADRLLELPLITVKKYGSPVINIVEVVRSLSVYERIIMLAEEIHPFNQGSKGSMTFGSALNLIGQLQAESHIELSLILPTQWKPKYGLDSRKILSKQLALKKGLPWEGKLSELSHNLAESYLLACFVYEACTLKSA